METEVAVCNLALEAHLSPGGTNRMHNCAGFTLHHGLTPVVSLREAGPFPLVSRASILIFFSSGIKGWLLGRDSECNKAFSDEAGAQVRHNSSACHVSAIPKLPRI